MVEIQKTDISDSAHFKTSDHLLLIDQKDRIDQAPLSYPSLPKYKVFDKKKLKETELTELGFKILSFLINSNSFAGVLKKINHFSELDILSCLHDLHIGGLIEHVHVPSQSRTKRIKAERKPGLDGIPIAPQIVIWLSTFLCNFTCTHCINYEFNHPKPSEEMDYDQVLTMLNELERWGVQHLQISGGEPFSRPDMLSILRAASAMNIQLTILTNGSLLQEEIINDLKDIYQDHKKKLMIHLSIDGASNTHDSFRRYPGSFQLILECINKLAKHNFKVQTVETIATRENRNELEDIIRFCIDAGVSQLCIHPVYPFGNGRKCAEMSFEERLNYFKSSYFFKNKYRDQLDIRYGDLFFPLGILKLADDREFRRQMSEDFLQQAISKLSNPSQKKYLSYELQSSPPPDPNYLKNCTAGINRMLVSSDGSVYPCLLYIGSTIDYCGNICEESLQSVWESKGMLRARIPLKTGLLSTCSHCSFFKNCGNDVKKCRIGSERSLDDFWGPSPLCVKFAESLSLDTHLIKKYKKNRYLNE